MHPDIVYLTLHGKGCEDGCIQGVLELAGILYSGPRVAASALCMNKVLSKQVMKAAGISTAEFLEFRKNEFLDISIIASIMITTLGIPVVLKSPCQGSSIGVIIVHNENGLIPSIEEIFGYGDQLLAEEFIRGIEITLPIIGNDDLTVLPDIEITSEREFSDYRAKYTTGLCPHIIPSRVCSGKRRKVQDNGQKENKELNCCGISYIDFLIDKVKGQW